MYQFGLKYKDRFIIKVIMYISLHLCPLWYRVLPWYPPVFPGMLVASRHVEPAPALFSCQSQGLSLPHPQEVVDADPACCQDCGETYAYGTRGVGCEKPSLPLKCVQSATYLADRTHEHASIMIARHRK